LITLPGYVSPSTGTTPESIKATSTPLPVKPSCQVSSAFIASRALYIEPTPVAPS
jgi:hypothetical protein